MSTWHAVCLNNTKVRSSKDINYQKEESAIKVLKTSKPTKFTDPVCGMQVDPAQSLYVFIYQKKSYYFCAEGCLKSFKKDPDKFQKSTPGKRKNWWCRYTERLEKATGGKAFKCH